MKGTSSLIAAIGSQREKWNRNGRVKIRRPGVGNDASLASPAIVHGFGSVDTAGCMAVRE
jgi:hypothetical protein